MYNSAAQALAQSHERKLLTPGQLKELLNSVIQVHRTKTDNGEFTQEIKKRIHLSCRDCGSPKQIARINEVVDELVNEKTNLDSAYNDIWKTITG